MAPERLERPSVKISQAAAASLKKMSDVRCRAQVSHRARVRVAILFESVGKAINV